jgi:hypothetical protein
MPWDRISILGLSSGIQKNVVACTCKTKLRGGMGKTLTQRLPPKAPSQISSGAGNRAEPSVRVRRRDTSNPSIRFHFNRGGFEVLGRASCINGTLRGRFGRKNLFWLYVFWKRTSEVGPTVISAITQTTAQPHRFSHFLILNHHGEQSRT